jgi:hypothetical protein
MSTPTHQANSLDSRITHLCCIANRFTIALVIFGYGTERTLTCKSCTSDKQSKFTAEIAIHFPGLKGLEKPIVWVFPEVLVCLNCGKAEFAVPESELRALAKGNAAAAG